MMKRNETRMKEIPLYLYHLYIYRYLSAYLFLSLAAIILINTALGTGLRASRALQRRSARARTIRAGTTWPPKALGRLYDVRKK